MATGDRIYLADKETLDNIHSIVANERPKRYGYRIKISESNPDTRVEYLYDAVGMTPAAMNFTTGVFNYGSWNDIWFVRKNRPVILNNAGRVTSYLNPNDYSKRLDGQGSRVGNAETLVGNAMSAIPLVWVKRYYENGYNYVIFCESQYDNSYKAYAHTDRYGRIKPFAYHSIYKGCTVASSGNNVLRSISGQYITSNITPTNLYNSIPSSVGTNPVMGWNLVYWSLHELITDLLVLMSKSTNIRAKFGNGNISGYNVNDTTGQGSVNYGKLKSGTLDTRGQFYGFNTTNQQVKVFHIEGFWGDRWDIVLGLMYSSGAVGVLMNESSLININSGGSLSPVYTSYKLNYDVSSTTSTKHIPHIEKYDQILPGLTTSGFYKSMEQTEYGLFCTETGGSATTYECAYYIKGATEYDTSHYLAAVGGDCNSGTNASPRSLNFTYEDNGSSWNLGASLSYL